MMVCIGVGLKNASSLQVLHEFDWALRVLVLSTDKKLGDAPYRNPRIIPKEFALHISGPEVKASVYGVGFRASGVLGV